MAYRKPLVLSQHKIGQFLAVGSRLFKSIQDPLHIYLEELSHWWAFRETSTAFSECIFHLSRKVDRSCGKDLEPAPFAAASRISPSTVRGFGCVNAIFLSYVSLNGFKHSSCGGY